MRKFIGKILLLLSLLFIGYFSYSHGQYFSLESDSSYTGNRQFYNYFVSYSYFNNFSISNFVINSQPGGWSFANCNGVWENPPFSYVYISGSLIVPNAIPGYFGFNSNFTSFAFQSNWSDGSCHSAKKYYGNIETGLNSYLLTENYLRLFWKNGLNFNSGSVDYSIFYDKFDDGAYYLANGHGLETLKFANGLLGPGSKFFAIGNGFSRVDYLDKGYSGYSLSFKRNNFTFSAVDHRNFNSSTNTFDTSLTVANNFLIIDVDGLNKNGVSNSSKYLAIWKDDVDLRRLAYRLYYCIPSQGFEPINHLDTDCGKLSEGYLSYKDINGNFNTSLLPQGTTQSTNTTFLVSSGQWNTVYKYTMGWLINSANGSIPGVSTIPFIDVKLSGSNQVCFYNGDHNYCLYEVGVTDSGNTVVLPDGNIPNINLVDIIYTNPSIETLLNAGQSLGYSPVDCQNYNFGTAYNFSGTIDYKNKYWYCWEVVKLINSGMIAGFTGTLTYSGFLTTGVDYYPNQGIIRDQLNLGGCEYSGQFLVLSLNSIVGQYLPSMNSNFQAILDYFGIGTLIPSFMNFNFISPLNCWYSAYMSGSTYNMSGKFDSSFQQLSGLSGLMFNRTSEFNRVSEMISIALSLGLIFMIFKLLIK